MAKALLKAIRGMNDLLPAQIAAWHALERRVLSLFSNAGYQEIRTPIVESTEVFARSIGADTDIVSKEMYTFEDRNGGFLTLRPEGTAACARAAIEHGLLHNQQQRLWYVGPMFRRERPQKGRYRQFHQIGIEAFGWDSADIEAEVIGLANSLFVQLGLQKYRLEINSLGDLKSRAAFRDALKSYLLSHFDALDKDSQDRLERNPLRVLDSKVPSTQVVVADAPSILDYLTPESSRRFDALQSMLNYLDVKFTVNPRMVRGLDYYNDTVFEFICDEFGAQSTVCGGGRYDGLVEQMGGKPTAAFGFAIGIERLLQILEEQGVATQAAPSPSIYIISEPGEARNRALAMRQSLVLRGIHSDLGLGSASFKNQFKRADKSGAMLAVIIGEDEVETDSVSIKRLRELSVADSSVLYEDLESCADLDESHSKSLEQMRAGDVTQLTVSRNDAIDFITHAVTSL